MTVCSECAHRDQINLSLMYEWRNVLELQILTANNVVTVGHSVSDITETQGPSFLHTHDTSAKYSYTLTCMHTHAHTLSINHAKEFKSLKNVFTYFYWIEYLSVNNCNTSHNLCLCDWLEGWSLDHELDHCRILAIILATTGHEFSSHAHLMTLPCVLCSSLNQRFALDLPGEFQRHRALMTGMYMWHPHCFGHNCD